MARAAAQLVLDLERPVLNEAAARVLYCLRECLPPGALDSMYRRITNAQFEEVDRFSGSNRPCAVADMILFDGSPATCIVPTGEMIGTSWEGLGGGICWNERHRTWRRDDA